MAKANFHSLIKQELVNRFEDVVKNELREFSLTQQNNEKKFSEIKNNLNNLKDYIGLTIQENNKRSDNVIDKVKSDKIEFINECTTRLIQINKILNSVENELSSLNEIKENTVLKQDVMILKNSIISQLERIYILINDKEQNIYHSISEIIKKIHDIESNYELFVDKITQRFNKIISDFEERIKTFEINVQGYLQDLQAVKKKAFIQEKYIEKILTDLENMKNEASK